MTAVSFKFLIFFLVEIIVNWCQLLWSWLVAGRVSYHLQMCTMETYLDKALVWRSVTAVLSAFILPIIIPLCLPSGAETTRSILSMLNTENSFILPSCRPVGFNEILPLPTVIHCVPCTTVSILTAKRLSLVEQNNKVALKKKMQTVITGCNSSLLIMYLSLLFCHFTQ